MAASDKLVESRALQIQQGLPLDDYEIDGRWTHVFQNMFKDGTVARIGETAFTVYCCIKTYTNLNTGSAWPSIATVAQHCGKSDDTVQRAIKTLTAEGLVSVVKRGRSNVYSIIEKFKAVNKSGGDDVLARVPYVPTTIQSQIKAAVEAARSGNVPVNITLNVQNITQGDNGVVTTNFQNFSVKPGEDFMALSRNLKRLDD